MTKKEGLIRIVVGGVFGSESKGHVCGQLAEEHPGMIHVRTGSIQAGHSIKVGDEFVAMQSIPVGFVDQTATLVIGRGAYIEYDLLIREIETITRLMGKSPSDRLIIDPMCGIHTHDNEEAEINAGLAGSIGSTAHGVMEAMIDRMRRDRNYLNFRAWCEENGKDVQWTWADTSAYLNEAYDNGEEILLEGTQGTGLDFLHGDYPYVTSRPTIASHWMTEAGLSPSLSTEIVMVCRTYPIRVAGNSGPMGTEVSWADLARRVNALPEDLLVRWEEAELSACKSLGLPARPHEITDPKERSEYSRELRVVHKNALEKLTPEDLKMFKTFAEVTTVTRLLRRIAEPDFDIMRKFVRLNRPNSIALMFLGYCFPEVIPCKTLEDLKALPSWVVIKAYITTWETELKTPIRWLGVSRDTTIALF